MPHYTVMNAAPCRVSLFLYKTFTFSCFVQIFCVQSENNNVHSSWLNGWQETGSEAQPWCLILSDCTLFSGVSGLIRLAAIVSERRSRAVVVTDQPMKKGAVLINTWISHLIPPADLWIWGMPLISHCRPYRHPSFVLYFLVFNAESNIIKPFPIRWDKQRNPGLAYSWTTGNTTNMNIPFGGPSSGPKHFTFFLTFNHLSSYPGTFSNKCDFTVGTV